MSLKIFVPGCDLVQSVWSHLQAPPFWWNDEMERGRKEVEKDPQLVFGEGRGRKIAGRRESSHRPLISKCLLLRIASTLHLPEPIQADLRSYSLTLVYSRHRARALTVFGCSCIFAKCQYTPSHPSQNKRKHIRSSKARTVYWQYSSGQTQ